MTFAIVRNGSDRVVEKVALDLARFFERNGFESSDGRTGLQCVLNLTNAYNPKPFRRESRAVFVISIIHTTIPPLNLRAFCYAALVRSLSNLLVCVVSSDGSPDLPGSRVYFTTPEAGFYDLPYVPKNVFARVQPIASAHYATENRLVNELPAEYRSGTVKANSLRSYAAELDRLGVLPTPFPLKELLPEEDLRHLFRLFGMTGLSYGNLSIRERIPDFSEDSFWMTARGVDKARLGDIGKDILFVRTFDAEAGCARISMPPGGYSGARVSVDAVEHALIYKTFSAVGAIVHAHAWMEGIVSTRQNFPCGTTELAQEVCAMLRNTPEPGRAVVGLKNHGITVTGPDFEDIFDRMRGRLQTEVPMYG